MLWSFTKVKFRDPPIPLTSGFPMSLPPPNQKEAHTTRFCFRLHIYQLQAELQFHFSSFYYSLPNYLT